MLDLERDKMVEYLEVRHETLSGDDAVAATWGDIVQDRGAEGGAMQRQTARPDKDFRGRELVSGDQAFPHSLLSVDKTTGRATPNQLNHFAINSMISKKRRQRNT